MMVPVIRGLLFRVRIIGYGLTFFIDKYMQFLSLTEQTGNAIVKAAKS